MKKVRILILSMMIFALCSSSALAVSTLELSAKLDPVETKVTEDIEQAKNELLDETYPVGSIYTTELDMSASDMHDMFGGEWRQIKNTFLWAAGEENQVGTTGGKTDYEFTAALGSDEDDELSYDSYVLSKYMQSHNPNYSLKGIPLEDEDEPTFLPGAFTKGIPVTEGKKRTISIMPKYTAVRMFKRVE